MIDPSSSEYETDEDEVDAPKAESKPLEQKRSPSRSEKSVTPNQVPLIVNTTLLGL